MEHRRSQTVVAPCGSRTVAHVRAWATIRSAARCPGCWVGGREKGRAEKMGPTPLASKQASKRERERAREREREQASKRERRRSTNSVRVGLEPGGLDRPLCPGERERGRERIWLRHASKRRCREQATGRQRASTSRITAANSLFTRNAPAPRPVTRPFRAHD